MNIDDFEFEVHAKIVERGRAYYTEGRILELMGTPDGRFAATVSGTETYEIDCKLNEAGDILYSYCTCPYDYGPVCKHEVAFFFALRKNGGHLIWKDELPNDLRATLLSMSHRKLVAFLLSLTAEDDELYDLVKERLVSFEEK